MSVQAPRVLQKTVTGGTGPFSLLTILVVGFQRFRDAMPDGSVTTVVILDQASGDWQECLCKLTYGAPDTLTVLAVLSSSNGGAAVTFAASQKIILQCCPSYGSQAADRLKLSVRCCSTVNVTLSAVVPGYALDGVTLVAGDRVALLGQTTSTDSGIYVVQASGSPVRSADFSAGDTVSSALIPIRLGTAHGGAVYVVTSDPGSDVVGTNSLTFIQAIGPAPLAFNTVSGVGTTQSGAAALAADVNLLNTSTGQVAAVLPNLPNGHVTVICIGASVAATVFPPSGGAINGHGTNTGVSLGTLSSAANAFSFYSHDGTTWYSVPGL